MDILKSNLVDIENKKIYPAKIVIENSKIKSIEAIDEKCDTYILPGFIDAHIHIESSMLPPSEFAKLAITHATVATVSDPHEIANVMGVDGVDFMIENAKQSGFKFYFGASPCVPATIFETSGATLTPKTIEKMLQRDDIYFLSEVMNFPGVVNGDEDMLLKIKAAKKYNKPIDGHAPGLRGEALDRYIQAGISTDHEAYELEEAREKLQKGMKILIREGSAAKNFEALSPLIDEYYENLMFCSDDRHPDDLKREHINSFVKRALDKGFDLFKVLQIACVNPIKHYGLDVGLLKEGDSADFIEVKDLKDFHILKTFINGKLLFDGNDIKMKKCDIKIVNNFKTKTKNIEDFYIKKEGIFQVIKVIDGELITDKITAKLEFKNGATQPSVEDDILLIAVVNRYDDVKPFVAFINGFGLKKGAIASSVAHDSHNIIAVATSYEELTRVVNEVIAHKGGVVAVDGKKSYVLPLEIAGLMSKLDGFEVAKKYEEIDKIAKKLGTHLKAPYMTLSFMALLVIPKLKLSDKGLFDGENFTFVAD